MAVQIMKLLPFTRSVHTPDRNTLVIGSLPDVSRQVVSCRDDLILQPIATAGMM